MSREVKVCIWLLLSGLVVLPVSGRGCPDWKDAPEARPSAGVGGGGIAPFLPHSAPACSGGGGSLNSHSIIKVAQKK